MDRAATCPSNTRSPQPLPAPAPWRRWPPGSAPEARGEGWGVLPHQRSSSPEPGGRAESSITGQSEVGQGGDCFQALGGEETLQGQRLRGGAWSLSPEAQACAPPLPPHTQMLPLRSHHFQKVGKKPELTLVWEPEDLEQEPVQQVRRGWGCLPRSAPHPCLPSSLASPLLPHGVSSSGLPS